MEEIYIRHGSTEDGKAIGETWSGHAVHVKTDAAPGDYVRARIESAGPHVLYAGEPRQLRAEGPSAGTRIARRQRLVVCGPTASGKSDLSDALAERLTEAEGRHVPTLAVDSMQVYRELPMITNQARGRPAELVGIVSVTEEWTRGQTQGVR